MQKKNRPESVPPVVSPDLEAAIENVFRRVVSPHMKSTFEYPREFISIAEISDRTTLSKSCIQRLQKLGEFPRSRVLSKGRTAYVRIEVEAWIRQQAAENVAPTAGSAA